MVQHIKHLDDAIIEETNKSVPEDFSDATRAEVLRDNSRITALRLMRFTAVNRRNYNRNRQGLFRKKMKEAERYMERWGVTPEMSFPGHDKAETYLKPLESAKHLARTQVKVDMESVPQSPSQQPGQSQPPAHSEPEASTSEDTLLSTTSGLFLPQSLIVNEDQGDLCPSDTAVPASAPTTMEFANFYQAPLYQNEGDQQSQCSYPSYNPGPAVSSNHYGTNNFCSSDYYQPQQVPEQPSFVQTAPTHSGPAPGIPDSMLWILDGPSRPAPLPPQEEWSVYHLVIIKTEAVDEEEKPDVSQEESMQVDPADDPLAIPGPSGLCGNPVHTELDIKEEDDSIDTVVSSPPKSLGTDITDTPQASTSTPEYEEVIISDEDEVPPEEAGADWTPDSQSPKRRSRKSFPRKISNTKKPASAGLQHIIEQTGTVSVLHGHLHRKATRPQFITGGSPAVQCCKVLNVPPMNPAPGFSLCYTHEDLLPPGGCHGTVELNPLASCSIRSLDQSDSAYTFKEDSFLWSLFHEMRLNPQCITRFATLALMTEAVVMTSSVKRGGKE